MIYLFPDINNEVSIHYQPDLLTVEQKANGIAVETLPECDHPVGKYGILKATDSQNVWWDYVDKTDSNIELILAEIAKEFLKQKSII